jgi:hypothetical protein
MENTNWGFSKIWNESLLEKQERPMKKRDNLWASELGKSPIDIWLKLRATPMTNPPNSRSLRKFEAGNVFEWIVSLILKRAGILKSSQHWSEFQYPGLLRVSGKADFIAGGKVDERMFHSELQGLELPDVFMRAGERIVNYLSETYPDGLDEMPLEIKSVSSFMFEAMERTQRASRIHRLQAFHYLKSENRPKANLVYICRDDLRMMEFPILNPSPVEDEYRAAIEGISKYHLDDVRPPLELPITFDEDIAKFAKNFNVAYSGYLTMLYGFKDQKEFDDIFQPKVASWNRVMARVKKGDKMTEKNKLVLEDIGKSGFDVEKITKSFVSSGEDEEVPETKVVSN